MRFCPRASSRCLIEHPHWGGSLSPSLFQSKPVGCNWLHFKGTFKCGSKGCDYWRFIKKGQYVNSSTNGKAFENSQFINCNTKFLVYVITCEQSHVQYVGRTIRRLKDRLYDHLYDIENNKCTNVAKHWNLIYFKDVSSLSIQGMESIKNPARGGDRFRVVCKRKVYCIFSLHTRIPSGLNFKWNVSHYYD